MSKLRNRSVSWLIVIGLISIVMGFIFEMQSISLIGPSSSFMYSNDDWTLYGFIIMGIGIAVLIIGLYMKTRKI